MRGDAKYSTKEEEPHVNVVTHSAKHSKSTKNNTATTIITRRAKNTMKLKDRWATVAAKNVQSPWQLTSLLNDVRRAGKGRERLRGRGREERGGRRQEGRRGEWKGRSQQNRASHVGRSEEADVSRLKFCIAAPDASIVALEGTNKK